MQPTILANAVRSFLRKRPRTVLQANATHADQLAWEDARVFWFANFPVSAEKTAGYGIWDVKNDVRKGA